MSFLVLIEISTGFIEIQFGMAQQKEIAFDGLLSVLFLLLLPGIAVIYPFYDTDILHPSVHCKVYILEINSLWYDISI